MEPGSIVEFFEEKRLLCGVVLELKGERLHVLAQTGRELTLPPKRLLHAGPSLSLARLNRQELLKRLEETGNKRESLKAAINLEELWDLLVQEGQTSTAAELAELWFGRTSADEVAATGRCLRDDRFLFKHKDMQIIPNPPELVAQLKEQFERELARQQELEEIGFWLQAVWEGREHPAQPAWRDRVVAILRRMAVFGAEAPDCAQGKAYLDKARLNAADAPFRLLVRLGVFHEDEDLELYRLEVPLEFTPEVLARVRQLSEATPPDPYADHRRDLTNLKVITIDGERTRDFDDALSLEEAPEGWRLGIHISDVAAMVQPDCSLDLEARERGTSIYLPERRLPMLPEEISEDLLSLLAHQERRALSFLVTLSPEAEVLDWSIVPSRIQVSRRLTYHEVDLLLNQDSTLGTLARLSEKLREARLAQGGYELKLPEVWVVFTPQGGLQVSVEDQETPSRQLVAEAMVLANSLAARFLAEHGIPAVYRSQPEPREPIRREEHKSLLELWQDRRRLSRVVMDLEPMPHWGLGLDCYTLATSPIRRYLDLLTHRQLLAAVSELPPPYRRRDLEQILPVIEPAMRRAGQLKARRLRYWLLKYLAARVGQKKEALVLESLPRRHRLIFPDLLLELFMAAPPSQRFSPGDTILVRLDKVLPREDQIKVSLA
ncbi:MAG: ribonuclease R [Deltaproteobacteria bacterium]|nr:ribonuclease R [Deltaproteobacteria bacterium]